MIRRKDVRQLLRKSPRILCEECGHRRATKLVSGRKLCDLCKLREQDVTTATLKTIVYKGAVYSATETLWYLATVVRVDPALGTGYHQNQKTYFKRRSDGRYCVYPGYGYATRVINEEEAKTHLKADRKGGKLIPHPDQAQIEKKWDWEFNR